MNLFQLPWLELSLLLPLVGAVCVRFVRSPDAAVRWCLGFTVATLGCTLLVTAGYHTGLAPADGGPWGLQQLVSRPNLRLVLVDELTAPLLPLVALLHFLTALATTRTKLARFSLPGMLAGESLRLAAFACAEPWPLIALFTIDTLTPYFELRRRGQSTRVFSLHMGLFVVLLVAGWAWVDGVLPGGTAIGSGLLLVAVLIRSGAVPAHVWVTDLFENCTFGTALLYATPISAVYLAVRLVLPVAPDWVLQGLGYVSLITAVYTAGMAVVQRDARRFFAYLFLSHASLVLVGLELHTSISLTGALALWVSVALALSGLGLTLRALESRVGRLSLIDFHGLYEQSPALAICFMITGLASVGFPGTLGYVAADLLVEGAIEVNPMVGLTVIVAAALNGIAIVRVYFLLFTGGRHATGVALGITSRERFAVLTLAALILGGGLIPQAHLESRHRAAEAILAGRTGANQPR